MAGEQSKKAVFTTGYGNLARDRYAARNADNCCGYLLPYLKQLPTNFTFLDIGCGPGSITIDLASRFSGARFLGVEPGQPFVEKADELARERGVANISFQLGDMDSLDQIDGYGSFDVVHCHQVLVHLPDALAALKTMKGAAKPHGGAVACRESDLVNGHVFLPESEGLRDFHRMLVQTGKNNGSDPALGGKLLGLALKAGWSRDQITAGASTWCFTQPDERRTYADSMVGSLRNRDEAGMKRAEDAGVSKDGLEAMARAWEHWGEDDEGWSFVLSAEVLCKNQ